MAFPHAEGTAALVLSFVGISLAKDVHHPGPLTVSAATVDSTQGRCLHITTFPTIFVLPSGLANEGSGKAFLKLGAMLVKQG